MPSIAKGSIIILNMQNKYNSCPNRILNNSMKNKNENIKLWLLDELHKGNKAKALRKNAEIQNSENHRCPKCRKGFSEPKLIQYYVCPHCEAKFDHKLKKKEAVSTGLGFLLKKIRVARCLKNALNANWF